ncbi:hypothetical protein Peur_037887 [Populus x canadensis]
MGQPQGFYMFSHSCFNSGNCPKYFLHYFLFFQIQTFIDHGYSYRSDLPLFCIFWFCSALQHINGFSPSYNHGGIFFILALIL